MSHVRLYFGPVHSEKEEKARSLAKDYLKNSSHNLFEYFPEGKSAMHSIASIRSLIQEAMSRPFESDYKVLIVHGADRMLPSSANALLKTLEEPLESTVICLLTADLDAILPTIRSRCIKISCQPLKEKVPLALEEIDKLREEKPYEWALEVDALLEKFFETYQTVPRAAQKIEQVREAIFCHMKLKSAIEALHASLNCI
jgi:DNA polymerase III delta prime subunit